MSNEKAAEDIFPKRNYQTWYICYNANEEEVWRGFNADVGRTPGWSTARVEGQPFAKYLGLDAVVADAKYYPDSKISIEPHNGGPTLTYRAPYFYQTAPPATDEFVAPGCSLFSDPTKKADVPAPISSAVEGSHAWRKQRPVFSGVVNYFPDALMEVAFVSYVGNLQHNGDVPLKWTRQKSADHPDCELRHLMERGTRDTDGTLHSAKRAWRALADLQIEIEESRKQKESKNVD